MLSLSRDTILQILQKTREENKPFLRNQNLNYCKQVMQSVL